MATSCTKPARIGCLGSVLLLSIMLMLTGCSTERVKPVVNVTVPAQQVRSAQLTPIPYQMAVDGSRISVHNIDSASNNREIYWNSATPESASATQCATWTSGSGVAQNGLVFRIAQQSGGYNAIVLVRNIFVNMYWVFSPKMFHTGSDYETQWDSREADGLGTDLGKYLGRSSDDVWPLRVCASLSADNTMCFAVAKGFDPMPPLTNAGDRGGCWKLNIAEFYHSGEGQTGVNGGTFVGHIPVGATLVIDDTTLNGQPAPLPD